ncbi:HAD family hydrolase [Aerococcus urinae]|uniref:HAD family phosphatase n=2 Tax=Lactobacillales TaxID=186826 RepID=A0A109REE4_9LACT|nr:HAD family phosphatase [Aerococcus urinae]AMB95678.1 hypothetical protein AWM73_03780 [Aerococcus urinae]MCY3032861.1 HAD family phosphatase [Aerococcus urinae]MCY3037541.1 HAD family phosphatase [Aerococcus urinae]MCY3044908.1 HAD family phosphatase [Aerococcus urinae]MCY3046440.1 HAD family phosphatase [Aerococcus urinae]
MKSVVIFDMDGTLIDTESVYLKAYQEVFQARGIEFTDQEYIDQHAGRTAAACLQALVEKTGSQDLAKTLFNEAEQRFVEIEAESGIDNKAGLLETIEALKDMEVTIHVASSSNRSEVISRLKGAGISSYIDGFTSGDEVTHSKPHPEIFLKALEKTGQSKDSALIIEDSVAGVEAGFRSGIDTIMVPDLVAASEKNKAQALVIVDRLDDILNYVK